MNIYKSPGVHKIEFDIPKWLLRMNRIERVFKLREKGIKLDYTIAPKSAVNTITHNISILPTGSIVAGSNNTSYGYNSIAGGSANIAIGFNAMYSNCTGTNNIAYGYSALHSKKYKRINKVKNIWKET